jgi:hypothetical protein
MLPTTATLQVPDWKAETFSIFGGLRGLCILWVFWQHSTAGIKGTTQNTPSNIDRNNFNTATFLILTGFTTYTQQRGQKVRYSSFVLRNYFSLIPLNILALLFSGVPLLMDDVKISSAWQTYIAITNLFGFGLFSAAEGYTEHVDAATGLTLFKASNLYFGSMLFVLFGVYALFHWALTSSKMFRSLFQKSCIPALLLAILMIALSFLLGALDESRVTLLIADGQLQLLPMLMLGVCAAELRHQISSQVQAVMGYWLTVDALFAAFLAVTFCPYSYATNTATLATFNQTWATGFKDPLSVALLAMQQVFFCLLLMALSCQAFHKKRSIVVHFVLRRSLLSDVFGKYSYAFYLFQIPVLFQYYPQWAAMLGAKYAPGDAVGWVQWALQLLASMGVAMVAQWWQDEYVTSAYVSVRRCIDDGHLLHLWTSEQNPLSWCSKEEEEEPAAGPSKEDPLQALEAQKHHQQARC